MPTNGVFTNVYGASSTDMQKLQSALSYGSQNTQGVQLIHDTSLVQADLVINHSGINQTSMDASGHVTVSWDPNTAIEVKDSSGNIIGYESPASNLLHEMAHAADPYFALDASIPDSQYEWLADKTAIERTNSIVVALGELPRDSHTGGFVNVNNPTEHAANGQWTEVGTDGQTKSSTQPDSFNDNWTGTGGYDYDPEDPIDGGDDGSGYGGGYGGGSAGGCVSVDSLLPGGRIAGEIRIGDVMELADERSLEPGEGVVSYSQTKSVPGYRIVTESGVSLKCSDTAPIPTPEGLVLAPDLLGQLVPVRRDENGIITVGWEKVVSVTAIGDILVQHITVGDRCFWAGEKSGAYILHHNLKDAGGDDPDFPDDPWYDWVVAAPAEPEKPANVVQGPPITANATGVGPSAGGVHSGVELHGAHAQVTLVGVAHIEVHQIL